jgi:hypothetical protein
MSRNDSIFPSVLPQKVLRIVGLNIFNYVPTQFFRGQKAKSKIKYKYKKYYIYT